jgi:hypothetical protein
MTTKDIPREIHRILMDLYIIKEAERTQDNVRMRAYINQAIARLERLVAVETVK